MGDKLRKHKYRVGELIHICNEYGIYLGLCMITGVEHRGKEPTYYYEGSDTPWYSVPERCCFKSPSKILAAMKDRLDAYRRGDLGEDY